MQCFVLFQSVSLLNFFVAESGQYLVSIIHEHKPVSMRFKTAK